MAIFYNTPPQRFFRPVSQKSVGIYAVLSCMSPFERFGSPITYLLQNSLRKGRIFSPYQSSPAGGPVKKETLLIFWPKATSSGKGSGQCLPRSGPSPN